MDTVGASVRSRMMASIRSKDTQPERVVRSFLHARGFRYRLYRKDLPGRPDLVLPRWTAAVLVHGCFWHGHAGCRYFRLPRTRAEFWSEKISGNVRRDAQAIRSLHAAGWRVAVVWECSLRDRPASALADLESWIRSGDEWFEIFSEAAQTLLKTE